MTAEQFAIRLFDEIEDLISANVKTGFYDGKRGKMRKEYEENECHYNINQAGRFLFLREFIDTERKSRANCELRADHRTNIDILMEEIVEWIKSPL